MGCSKNKNIGFRIAICIVVLVTALVLLVRLYQKIEYPTEYKEEVVLAVRDFSVEEAWVFAVIRTESRFKPRARSGKGAMGLMQIMPRTGEYLYGKLYSGTFRESMLYDPKLNIYLGVYYISYLLNKFGRYDWALAAYNAGEGKVSEWIERGVGIGDIPYKETREYVKKCRRAYDVYCKKTT